MDLETNTIHRTVCLGENNAERSVEQTQSLQYRILFEESVLVLLFYVSN